MAISAKAFSLTHLVSVLSGMAVAITWTVEFFTHIAGNFTPANIFAGTIVPAAYAGVIGYYAMALKVSASGISETTTPPKA